MKTKQAATTTTKSYMLSLNKSSSAREWWERKWSKVDPFILLLRKMMVGGKGQGTFQAVNKLQEECLKVYPFFSPAAFYNWVKMRLPNLRGNNRVRRANRYLRMQLLMIARLYLSGQTKKAMRRATLLLKRSLALRMYAINKVLGSAWATKMSVTQLATLIRRTYKYTDKFKAQPVRRVFIPKMSGGKVVGERPLGVPSEVERIVGRMIKTVFELILMDRFESTYQYAYLANKSLSLMWNTICRLLGGENVQQVFEADFAKYFDTISHSSIMNLVEELVPSKVLCKYVRELLTAPIIMPDKTMVMPKQGTPQGGSLSPILANMVLHKTGLTGTEEQSLGLRYMGFADDSLTVNTGKAISFEEYVNWLGDKIKTTGVSVNKDKSGLVMERINGVLTAVKTFKFLSVKIQEGTVWKGLETPVTIETRSTKVIKTTLGHVIVSSEYSYLVAGPVNKGKAEMPNKANSACVLNRMSRGKRGPLATMETTSEGMAYVFSMKAKMAKAAAKEMGRKHQQD